MALLMRYTGPEATLSFGVMVDILLMVVIGGMGTLYGPALGAAMLVLAQSYLQPGLQAVADLLAPWPVLPALFQPDRWLLWLGPAVHSDGVFLPGRRGRQPPPGEAVRGQIRSGDAADDRFPTFATSGAMSGAGRERTIGLGALIFPSRLHLYWAIRAAAGDCPGSERSGCRLEFGGLKAHPTRRNDDYIGTIRARLGGAGSCSFRRGAGVRGPVRAGTVGEWPGPRRGGSR